MKAQETSALEEAVDVLDMLIFDITHEAKKAGQKKRLMMREALDRAARRRARACELLLDENTDDDSLRKAISNDETPYVFRHRTPAFGNSVQKPGDIYSSIRCALSSCRPPIGTPFWFLVELLQLPDRKMF